MGGESALRGVLPPALAAEVKRALAAAGDDTPLQRAFHVGGGDINHSARVETAQAAYFVKWHSAPPPRFFECEAAGLRLLAEVGVRRAGAGFRVPQVIGSGAVPGERAAFLVLSWIEARGGKSAHAAETLGRGLALLHRQTAPRYGLDHDNYIGRLPQPNRESTSWVAFYRDQRLGAQRDLAARAGLLPERRARRLERLMARLDEWIDERLCRPSPLHGDLWGGNWLVDADGSPVLIDPAVYYGDREADLAMTALFGGFPAAFYDAYEEVYPLAPGHQQRQDLYKLYYLLCHLNLFGEGYGGSVDSILQRYVG
ncbi:MAG: fructosamine kinase family protein [Anaerolineae bacterium]